MKLAPRRHVVEQILDGDLRAAWKCAFAPRRQSFRRQFRLPFRSRSAWVSSVSRETEAMEGSASPRNPSVLIENRSSGS